MLLNAPSNILTRHSSKDLMWSDPDEVETWAVSPRGAGWLFGASVTREVGSHTTTYIQFTEIRAFQFNHVNSLQLIARAHQLVQEGYKYMFDEELVTVWSAPNYCYRCGNLASILTIKENGEQHFEVFNAAPENEKDSRTMMASRRVVRLPFA